VKKIKFSICIPNYNYGHLIAKTIQSVLNQEYSNFEIIVSDNASTDNSINVINSFNDKRIKLFENKINIGFSANLDKASEHSTGDYIVLLSSDDLINPKALIEYENLIVKNNGLNDNLILMSGALIIDENDVFIGRKNAKTGDVIKYLNKKNIEKFVDEEKNIETYDGHLILKSLLSGTFQPAGQFLTTCFSRKLFHQVEGYRSNLTIYPDAHFSHKLLFCNPKVIYVNKYLFSYRVHGSNNLSQITSMKNVKNLTDNYIISQSYSEIDLKKIGLCVNDLITTFIENIINKSAFFSVLRGKFTNSMRILSFGFAAYSILIFKSKYFFFTLLLIPFIPIIKLYYYFKQFNVSSND